MKIFQGLPSCTEIWKCQTERWMLNLHLYLAWIEGQTPTAWKCWKAQLTVKGEERNAVHAFRDAPGFPPLIVEPVSLPLFCWAPAPYGGLIWAGWKNGGLGRWEPRAHRAWIRATICPVPLSVEPCTCALFERVITGELKICSFREHNLGKTFLIYIEERTGNANEVCIWAIFPSILIVYAFTRWEGGGRREGTESRDFLRFLPFSL